MFQGVQEELRRTVAVKVESVELPDHVFAVPPLLDHPDDAIELSGGTVEASLDGALAKAAAASRTRSLNSGSSASVTSARPSRTNGLAAMGFGETSGPSGSKSS